MPHYNFEEDFKIAEVTERDTITVITDFFAKKNIYLLFICTNSDGKYDLLFHWIKDPCKLYKVTFEVKEDFSCQYSNNVGVEYSCRGRDSGINKTEADFYIYKIHRQNKEHGTVDFLYGYWIIPVIKLKEIIKDNLYFRTVNGGDPGSNSLNYLFKFDIFSSNCKLMEPETIDNYRHPRL